MTHTRILSFVPVLVSGLALAIVSCGCRVTAPQAGPGADKDQNMIENRFPGYEPKATPDTVLDYRPRMAGRVAELPPASLESLPRLIEEIARMQALALQNPGQWEAGSVPLGGDPQEYRPSDEELLVSELGERIGQVVTREDTGAVRRVLDAAGIKIKEIAYGRILFRHADVMGSGRFFYASAPIQTTIALREPVLRG